MADIFGYNRNARPQRVFTTENSTLTLSGGAGVGYMIQNWNIGYQQNVQEIFELGSSNLYWIKGQPQGSGTIARIVGNSGNGVNLFPTGAFDLCDGGATMNIAASSGACDGVAGSVNLSMDGVVVTAIGFSMAVQDMMVQQNFGWRFAKLTVA